VIVAVKMTELPYTEGFTDEVTAVDVLVGAVTVTVALASLPPPPVSQVPTPSIV
jgi:hypothetical protein